MNRFLKLILLKAMKLLSQEYIHTKTGNKYYALFISNEFSGRDGFPQTVVYVSEGMVIYSRPLSEFQEKFESVNKPKVFPI